MHLAGTCCGDLLHVIVSVAIAIVVAEELCGCIKFILANTRPHELGC